MKSFSNNKPSSVASVDTNNARSAGKLSSVIEVKLGKLSKSAAGKLSARPSKSFLRAKSMTRTIPGLEKK